MAVGVMSGSCRAEENDAVAELAQFLVLPGFGRSDACSPVVVGIAATSFADHIATGESLAALGPSAA